MPLSWEATKATPAMLPATSISLSHAGAAAGDVAPSSRCRVPESRSPIVASGPAATGLSARTSPSVSVVVWLADAGAAGRPASGPRRARIARSAASAISPNAKMRVDITVAQVYARRGACQPRLVPLSASTSPRHRATLALAPRRSAGRSGERLRRPGTLRAVVGPHPAQHGGASHDEAG